MPYNLYNVGLSVSRFRSFVQRYGQPLTLADSSTVLAIRDDDGAVADAFATDMGDDEVRSAPVLWHVAAADGSKFAVNDTFTIDDAGRTEEYRIKIVTAPKFGGANAQAIEGILTTRLLSPWERTVSIFSQSTPLVAGVPGNRIITLSAANVAAHFIYGRADLSDATGLGRIKDPSRRTADAIYLPANVAIDDDWWILDTSPGLVGNGQVYRVISAPVIGLATDNRGVNRRSVLVALEEKPPAEVTA